MARAVNPRRRKPLLTSPPPRRRKPTSGLAVPDVRNRIGNASSYGVNKHKKVDFSAHVWLLCEMGDAKSPTPKEIPAFTNRDPTECGFAQSAYGLLRCFALGGM